MIEKLEYFLDGATELKREKNECLDREQKARETGNEEFYEGQHPNASEPKGGLLMMSLKNRTRRTEGGQVCSVPWATVGLKIVDQTHRRATAEEIRIFREQEEARRAEAEAQQARLDRRHSIVVRPLAPMGKVK